jgi:hypothetical protein
MLLVISMNNFGIRTYRVSWSVSIVSIVQFDPISFTGTYQIMPGYCLTLTLVDLEKIRNDVENSFVQNDDAKLTELHNNNDSHIHKVVGEFFASKAECGWEYFRQNVYDEITHLKQGSKKSIQTTTKFPGYLDRFFKGEDYLKQFQKTTKAVKETGDKKDQFADSNWVYYYYDDVGRSVGISTGFLYIDENYTVKIIDRLHDINQNVEYVGSFDFIVDGTLMLMTLNIPNSNERDLHIVAQAGNLGHAPTIMLGQYHNINHSNSIVSGSLILQTSSYSYDRFVPKFYKRGSKDYGTLKEHVRRFFESKVNNRIKLPKKIFDYRSLKRWLDEKRLATANTAINIENAKIFISSPTTSLESEDNYKVVFNELKSIKELLVSAFSAEVFCTLLKFDTYKKFKESNIILMEIWDELNTCDLFMMIWPQQKLHRQSSILVELGYMMAKTIPKIIFIQNGVSSLSIPNLLEGAIKKGIIVKYDFDTFEDLKNKIQINGLDLFKVDKTP